MTAMRKLALLPLLICIGVGLRIVSGPKPVFAQTKALLLFGGEDHKIFLGCLNCADTSEQSVCNDIGKYGSDIAPDSIWNDIGKYGSDISQHSPWNDIANDAPVIVDSDGKSYGYFSTNSIHRDRTRINWLVAILDYYAKTNDLGKTRKRMCD
jgi:hypothetical protein